MFRASAYRSKYYNDWSNGDACFLDRPHIAKLRSTGRWGIIGWKLGSNSDDQGKAEKFAKQLNDKKAN